MADRYASLKQGLVGCWIPSISGSGLLLPDLSGRGNNGVLTNMDASDWVSGQYGRALDFDGSDDRVDISNESSFDFERTAQFSVTFWARLNTLSPTAQVVASKLNPVAANEGWEVRFFSPFPGVDSNAINLILANNVSGGNFLMCTAAVGSLAVNQWYHVGVTYSGSSAASGVSLFLSGQRLSVTVNTDALTASILNDLQVRIGQRANSSNTFPLNGQLDDIRVYSRALTESEIRLLASEPGIGFKPAKKLSSFSTRYTYKPPKAKVFEGVRVRDHDYASLRQGLVGAWCPSLPNGGSGNTLPDQSGRGNHGTLTNMGPEDWVSGQYGRALDFDGVNDVVITSNATTSFLFRSAYASAWIFPRNNNVAKTIFKNGYTNNTGNNPFDGIQIVAWSDGNLYGSIRNTSIVDTDFFASAAYSANSWIHVAVWVGIDGTIRLYVNGRQTGTTQDASAIASSSLSFGAPPTIGARYEASLALLTYFNGLIDDVRWGYTNTDSVFPLLASRRGIGLQPSPTRFIAREKKTGLRRKILTGQT